MSAEGEKWLSRRVRVYAGFDTARQHGPIAEGVVVGYAPSPTITVRAENGTQSDWQVTLPIEVLEEDAEIPAASWDRLPSALIDDLMKELGYLHTAKAMQVLRAHGLVH